MKQVVPELAANDGLRLWYRFLNCGYRLTATAGTDKMTTFVTVGANRVFVRLKGDEVVVAQARTRASVARC